MNARLKKRENEDEEDDDCNPANIGCVLDNSCVSATLPAATLSPLAIASLIFLHY